MRVNLVVNDINFVVFAKYNGKLLVLIQVDV